MYLPYCTYLLLQDLTPTPRGLSVIVPDTKNFKTNGARAGELARLPTAALRDASENILAGVYLLIGM